MSLGLRLRYNSWNPSFSPDGSKIVFDSFTALDGSWNGSATLSRNIWIMDADGSNLTPLTQNSASGYSSVVPSFSADGNRIVFYSSTALDKTWNGTAANSNIWLYNLISATLTPITLYETGPRCIDPGFSSDGQKLVFSCMLREESDHTTVYSDAYNVIIYDIHHQTMQFITNNSLVGMDSHYGRLLSLNDKVLYKSKQDLNGSIDGLLSSSYNIWIQDISDGSKNSVTQNISASLNSELFFNTCP